MRFATAFLFVFVQGCGVAAFAGDANSTLPPRVAQSTLPARCDCSNGGECLCSPEKCTCPGCPKHTQTVSEESDLPQIPRFAAPVQYQRQCVNGVCTLVPVTQSLPAAVPVMSAPCPTCPQSAPMQFYGYTGGSCSDGSCSGGSCSGGSCGRSFQPARRVFGIFRGRRGCGG